jgi:hypothetical protein
MWLLVFLSFALLASVPGMAQVSIGATSGLGYSDGLGSSGGMRVPAPINGDAYPMTAGVEQRSNFLRVGAVVTTAFNDNVLGDAFRPVKDVAYLIDPVIALDKTTSRFHVTLSYTPGFTVYQQTSALNQVSQYLTLASDYRLTRHFTLSLQDSLQYTSNFLDQPDPFITNSGGVSSTPLYAIIAPVAGQIANGTHVEARYQFDRNGMVGATGTFSSLHYLKTTENLGIYDSQSDEGAVFYNRRLSKRHYAGGMYQHSDTTTFPIGAKSKINSDTFFGFYTYYPRPTWSFSFSGGPQHYVITQNPYPGSGSWSPVLTGSMGWQGRHTAFSASLARIVGGGGGLVGAFQSLYGSVNGRWLFARNWSGSVTGTYFNNKDVTPTNLLSTEGGHSVLGTISVQRQLNQRWSMEFGYSHLIQVYSGIPVLSREPNTNRGWVSFSYHLTRPLGG